MTIFSSADLDALSAPHVRRAWFGEIELPSGTRNLHTGMGRIALGGKDWEGISDPFGGQLVGLNGIEEPSFGQAVAVDVVLSGANKAFLKSMWDDRHAVEGARADLYFAVFDAETGDVLIPLKKLFPGKLTAPRFSFIGSAIRAIMPRIVSVLEGMNFPSVGAMWSPSGQRARYPGDKGLDFINSDIVETYKA